jgi:hypothetical protein
MHVTGYHRNPDLNAYPRSIQITRWFENMPVMPVLGQTIHFDDRAWKVTSVALVPDDDHTQPTPADTGWHIEIYVGD